MHTTLALVDAERDDPPEGSLREGPYDSNTYLDWSIDRTFVAVPMQQRAARLLKSLVDHPPRQTAASFNLDKV